MMAMEERLSRLEGAYEHLATKADLAELKGELKAEMAEMEGGLKAEMAHMEVRLVRWMIGIIVAAVGVTGTISFTAARLMS